MATVLYCEHERGEVVLPAGIVAGRLLEARRYAIQDHLVSIEAGDPAIEAADAAELCRLPGFRLATAEEANQASSRRKKATSVQE